MAVPSAAWRFATHSSSPAADIMKHMKMSGVFAALALAGAMSAQVATQANSQYQTEQGRKAMAAGLGAAVAGLTGEAATFVCRLYASTIALVISVAGFR